MKTMWLKCEVLPGQFTGEFIVKSTDIHGIYFSLFVTEAELDTNHEHIRVLEIERTANRVLVSLPAPTLENGNTVTVDGGKLTPVTEPEYA